MKIGLQRIEQEIEQLQQVRGPKLVSLESLFSETDKEEAKTYVQIATLNLAGQVEWHKPSDMVYDNVNVLRDTGKHLVGRPVVVGG